MVSFTTTHSHDYRWPNSTCLVPRAEAPSSHCEGVERVDKPWCVQDAPPPPPCTESTVCREHPTSAHRDRPWCQRGTLVPLINPRVPPLPSKVRLRPPGCPEESPTPGSRPWCDGMDMEHRVVSARVGAAPQQETSRYNQPNQYLQKLCDKYPRPTAVVTATPRDELMRRIYADRYRTTYQSDFCKNSDDTARQLEECDTPNFNSKHTYYDTPDERNVSGLKYKYCKCGCGCCVAQNVVSQPSAGDAQRLRPLACRPAAVSKNVHFSCCSPKKNPHKPRGEEVGPPEKIPPWASEYNEGIGRTGQLIMDQKLHYQKKKY